MTALDANGNVVEESAEIRGRCATCRHAEKLDRPEWTEEDSPVMALNRRYPLACKLAEMTGGYPDEPRTLAFTMDGSSYRASLLVSPDFGCIQYEAEPARILDAAETVDA